MKKQNVLNSFCVFLVMDSTTRRPYACAMVMKIMLMHLTGAHAPKNNHTYALIDFKMLMHFKMLIVYAEACA